MARYFDVRPLDPQRRAIGQVVDLIRDLARLDHAVDAVVDSGDCGTEPTTVIDLCGPEPEIVRRGAGDPARFE
jgi:predicted fused transcriptional regulator/phosphomethylpyrimidine kinase